MKIDFRHTRLKSLSLCLCTHFVIVVVGWVQRLNSCITFNRTIVDDKMNNVQTIVSNLGVVINIIGIGCEQCHHMFSFLCRPFS